MRVGVKERKIEGKREKGGGRVKNRERKRKMK